MKWLASGILICAAALPVNASIVPVTSTGADGAFHPAQSVTLAPNADSRFDFTTINIPAEVKVDALASQFPSGLIIAATGDIDLFGQLDVSGTDLHISTPGTFHIHEGGSFLADEFHITVNTLIIDGEFVPVDGGSFDIERMPSGVTLFSGRGVTLTLSPASEPIFLESPYLIVDPPAITLQAVPIPAGLWLLVSALVGAGVMRRGRANPRPSSKR